MSGLTYSTKTLYYRVCAYRGSSQRCASTIGSFTLRPATPTKLTLSNSGAVVSLGWARSAVTGYQVEQATNRGMTTGRKTYTLRTGTPQLTPYGLAKRATYWWRVRAVNHGSVSPWTKPVSGTITTSEQSLTVMSYNILEAKFGGTIESGNKVASWHARRTKVAALVVDAAPDILTIQEGATFVGTKANIRQVDDLDHLLTDYTLARTEPRPRDEPNYHRRGVYILYRTAAFTPAYYGGVIHTVPGYAAEIRLRSLATGAEIEVISPHLPKTTGLAGDQMRERATRRLIDIGSGLGRPAVVYAGDFNSDNASTHAFDGSGRAMSAAGHADAIIAAQTTKNAQFNSANQYLRTPPAHGDSIDHIYAPPGVAIQSYAVLLHLTRGRFVGAIPSDHNPVLATISIRY